MPNKTNKLMVTTYPLGSKPRDLQTFPKTRLADAIRWAKAVRPSTVWDRKTGEVYKAWLATDEFDDSI